MFPSGNQHGAAPSTSHEPDDDADDPSLTMSHDLLHHDADLLRQRRPAPRPRLHDDRRRRARALSPHARRRHAVPHRHRRARPEGRGGREQARADAAAARRSGRAAVRRDLEDARHRRATTSSAPPTRSTSSVVASCGSGSASTTPTTSTSRRTRAGTASAARRSTPRASSSRTATTWMCAVHKTPVDWIDKERSWFFRLSKYAEPLLAHIEAHPDFIRPEQYRNEIVVVPEGRPARSVGLAHELRVGHPGARARSRGPART